MTHPEIRRCKACAAPLPAQSGPGRKADYCLEHADKGNRSRRIKRQTAAAEPNPTPIDAAQERALGALEPMRLAAALSIVADPEAAAAVAGIEVRDDVHLAALHASATRDHADLIARRSTAVGALVWQAMTLQLLNLIARASRMAPGQSAGAIKQLAQTMELLTGGAQPTYTKLVIAVAGAEDDDSARIEAMFQTNDPPPTCRSIDSRRSSGGVGSRWPDRR